MKTKGSLVNQKISFARTVEMKLAMFECYNDFFKHVLDEDAYERKRLQVYHFLVDAAKDGFVFPATIPGTQKLGEERSQALQEVISEDGIIVEKYRDRKLLERYLESVALKYDMTLAELSLLLYRKDAGKALTRGAEAQMPAREDAVEATDRKDAGKALSRKDLAELMHMSRGDLRAALQKLVSRGMLEVVDVPRKRREAAEIAEATGLFGKRGEAQDADANGMTKKNASRGIFVSSCCRRRMRCCRISRPRSVTTSRRSSGDLPRTSSGSIQRSSGVCRRTKSRYCRSEDGQTNTISDAWR